MKVNVKVLLEFNVDVKPANDDEESDGFYEEVCDQAEAITYETWPAPFLLSGARDLEIRDVSVWEVSW